MADIRNGYWLKDDNGNLVASGVRGFQLGACLGADVVLLLLRLDAGSVQIAKAHADSQRPYRYRAQDAEEKDGAPVSQSGTRQKALTNIFPENYGPSAKAGAVVRSRVHSLG
ncbi:MAG: hypothetical protein K2P94_14290 [Rhodospirillaceae bacterium]|nr:hypothetical protein [Rhodospirillaceae bacterium]